MKFSLFVPCSFVKLHLSIGLYESNEVLSQLLFIDHEVAEAVSSTSEDSYLTFSLAVNLKEQPI